MDLNFRNKKILIVEDSITIRNAIRRILEKEGYLTELAENGRIALEKLGLSQPAYSETEHADFEPEAGKNVFDLILMDIVMPEMDGLETCHTIKSFSPDVFTPILLLTSLDQPEDIARGLDAGADDYISKNADHKELLARVRANLRIKHYHDELQKAHSKLEAAAELLASMQTATQLYDLVGNHMHNIRLYAQADSGSEPIVAEVDSVLELLDRMLDQLATSYDRCLTSPRARSCDMFSLEDQGTVM